MSVLGKVVRAGVGRRRVQTTVMTLTVLVAVTASVLSAGLLVAARAPFERAFADRSGAHLSVQLDGGKVSAAQAAATAHAAGVTGSAGPFPVVNGSQLAFGADCPNFPDGMPTAGAGFRAGTVVGRSTADAANTANTTNGMNAAVDKLALVAGRWPAAPTEISLVNWPRTCLGKSVVFDTAPDRPSFTVVGIGDSITRSADAWVTPAGLARLTGAGVTPNLQMLYRFAANDTDAQIAADRSAVAAALPTGALLGSQSYLDVKRQTTGDVDVFVPFLVVFGVLGLFLSVLIIAIVVSGAVVAAIRRIGILKALGFTPAQVARAYVAQALVPALVGAALGLVAAQLLAGPVLNGGEQTLGMRKAAIPWWVYAGVPGLLLVVVMLTALVPALRAGRLRAVDALVAGRTPQSGRGRTARRLAGRLPLPRPISLGLAQPFARPARTVTVAAAVVFGTLSATFALGLEAGFAKFQDIRSTGTSAGAVQIGPRVGPGLGQPQPQPQSQPQPKHGPRSVVDPASVAAALAAQPGAGRYFGYGQTTAVIVGASSESSVTTVAGDMTWAAYPLLSGRWFAAPGEAVVADRLASAAGIHVGDTLTAQDQGRTIALNVVGVDFDLRRSGLGVLTPTSTYTALGLVPTVEQFQLDLKSGTSLQEFLASANPVLEPLGVEAIPNQERSKSDVVVTMSALVATLTLMLVTVAALGVLNTVVQDTRERVHELGVFKALGMTPRQTVTMVLTSVAGIGLVAGLVGVPLGILVEHSVMPSMGNAVGMHLPPVVTDVYRPGLVAPLLAGGLVIAVLGAFLPAGWAAKTRTATALRSE